MLAGSEIDVLGGSGRRVGQREYREERARLVVTEAEELAARALAPLREERVDRGECVVDERNARS
jgi:hypothetical protein